MKKIIKQSLLAVLVIALLCMTQAVFAVTTGEFTVKAENKTYRPGEELTVTVGVSNFTNTGTLVDVLGKIVYNSNELELTKITANKADGWSGVGNVKANAFTYGSSEIEGNSTICTMTFKIKDNFEGDTTVTVNPQITDGQGFTSKSVTIKVAKEEQNNPELDNPETPDNPDNPDTQDTPEAPGTPETPENPDNPETPDNPDNPDTQDTPEDPGTPETPENPDNPGTPDNPDNPDTQDTPENPGTTDTPNSPDDTDNQDNSSTPETPDKPENENTQSQNKGDDEYDGTIPKTGENNTLIIVLASIFSIVIIALIVRRIIAKNNSLKK